MGILRASLAAIVAVALVGASSHSFAAEAEAPPPAVVKPEAVDLAERYLRLIELDRVMESLFKALIPVMMNQEARRHPSMTPQVRKEATDAILESVNATMADVLKRFAPLLAETYTVEELRAAVAFHSSPEARSMKAKEAKISEHMAKLIRDARPALEADIKARLCERLGGCSKDEPSQTKS